MKRPILLFMLICMLLQSVVAAAEMGAIVLVGEEPEFEVTMTLDPVDNAAQDGVSEQPGDQHGPCHCHHAGHCYCSVHGSIPANVCLPRAIASKSFIPSSQHFLSTILPVPFRPPIV